MKSNGAKNSEVRQKSIVTRTCEIFIREDGIIQINSFPDVELTRDDAVAAIAAQASLTAVAAEYLHILLKK